MNKTKSIFSNCSTKRKTSPTNLNEGEMKDLSDDLATCSKRDILKVKPRFQAVKQRALKLNQISLKQGTESCNNSKRNPEDVFQNNGENKSCYKSINISDLVAEETIVLDSPLKVPDDDKVTQQKNHFNKQSNISFEPSEITGRSTLFNKIDTCNNKNNVTVEDILASSICQNIRRITINSNNTASFPQIKSTDVSLEVAKGEIFQPAEEMTSQLLSDELSWENGYMPIPSAEAIQHDLKKNGYEIENSSNQSTKNSIDFSNISEVGKYFQKRSDKIESIISRNILSPPKRNPVKLIKNVRSIKSNEGILKSEEFAKENSKVIDADLSTKTEVLTMSAVQSVLKELNLHDFLNFENKIPNKRSTNIQNIIAHEEPVEKENLTLSNNKIYENDTVTFTESLLNDSNFINNGCNMDDVETNFDESNYCVVRSANSPLKLSEIYLSEDSLHNDMSKKPLRSFKKTLTPESSKENNSMSLTKLTEKNNSNFLMVNNEIHPPLSPIRSKALTPKNQNEQNLTSTRSLFGSPRACSRLSTYSSKSQSALDTTAQSEQNFLSIDRDKKSLLCTTKLPSFRSRSKSPTTNCQGLLKKQYTAGSLISVKSRCNSQCSSSSEFTHKHGQSLPIKATLNQCCFGSVKLRTIIKKTLGIRNISNKRLSFKVGIEGPGFQIDNVENNSIITLQGQECRTLSIAFCPTVLGAANGTLNFSSPYEGWPIDKVVLLQGYGGHASIKVRDFLKGPVGPPYINMGEIQELSQPLVKTFSIHNRGPLNGFAIINLNSTGLSITNLHERIEIEPTIAFLPAESTFKFRICFKPNRSDIRKIIAKSCDVMTIAHIRIITGDDPTRQRIRNIINKEMQKTSNKDIILPELTQTKLSKCWSSLPDEIILKDFNTFFETPENALELANEFRDWEAAITITHCFMDITRNTSNIVFPDLDETILFRTMICAGNDKLTEDSLGDFRFVESCTIRPNVLQFCQTDLDKNLKFTITSFFKSEQYFEIVSNIKNIFKIHPREGQLLPGEAVIINVKILKNLLLPEDNVNIMVYFEHEKINVPVIFR